METTRTRPIPNNQTKPTKRLANTQERRTFILQETLLQI